MTTHFSCSSAAQSPDPAQRGRLLPPIACVSGWFYTTSRWQHFRSPSALLWHIAASAEYAGAPRIMDSIAPELFW